MALSAIGARTVAEALILWESVPAASRADTASTWLRSAIATVGTGRAASKELALAYYRLVRALHTGTTIANPRKREPASISLGALRREFEALARQSVESAPPPAPGTPPAPAPEAAGGKPGGTELVPIERLPRSAAADRAQERAEREEARDALAALGAAYQQRLTDKIDTALAAVEVDRLRDEAHDRAGARQAASAARMAMNGGRGELWKLGSGDKRVIGYVRLSRTGTPCGWCAMLISRGAVYRSEKSATLAEGAAEYEDGDKYHDNCNCYAEPVFSRQQFSDSPRYELNRKYAELWKAQIRNKGLKGKAALSEWRKLIRDEYKALAQEAGATPSVQEA